jgi:integrase
MAVRKRGDGWQADVQHKRDRHRESFTSEREARVWEHEAREALRKGKPVPKVRSDAAADGYDTLGGLVKIVTATKWMKPGAHQMVTCANRLVAFAGALVPTSEGLSQDTIDRFLAHIAVERQISDTTVNKYRSAISVLVKRAMAAGKLTLKPDLTWAKEGKVRLRFFTPEEALLVEQTFRLWDKPVVADFFVFLLYTGARTWREGAQMTWQDVNLREGSVLLWDDKGANGRRFRSVPLVQQAYDAIKRQEGNGLAGPFVSLNKDDCRGVYDRLRAHIPALADTVWYTARHTFASWLVQRGVGLYEVSKLMGHTDPKMTQRYAHLAPKNLIAAVSVLGEPAVGGPKLVVDNDR